MKRVFSEMSENDSTAKETIQDFITRQMQGLLNRIADNGPLSFSETELLKYAALAGF
jgi:hypothetical protein